MEPVTTWAQVGDRVRRARQALGFNQAALAQRIQLDRTAVAKIESGTRNVSALELNQLADALGLPIAYFVSREPTAVTAYRATVTDAPPQSDSAAERAAFFLDAELEQHARDAQWLFDGGALVPPPPFTAGKVETRDDAVELARRARRHIENDLGPLGSMATEAERFGLYVKVIRRGTGGASLRIDEGFGVAVVGVGSDPGRRRTTAAHELGHHLWGDAYNTDVGVAAADDEKERLVDAFAGAFLLPGDVVQQIEGPRDVDSLRPELVRLAADYRVSWSLAIHVAQQVHGLSAHEYRRLEASTPLRGDFLEVVGYEPRYDLEAASSGPRWRKASLAAYTRRLASPQRTLELVNGSLTLDDLPAVEDEDRP